MNVEKHTRQQRQKNTRTHNEVCTRACRGASENTNVREYVLSNQHRTTCAHNDKPPPLNKSRVAQEGNNRGRQYKGDLCKEKGHLSRTQAIPSSTSTDSILRIVSKRPRKLASIVKSTNLCMFDLSNSCILMWSSASTCRSCSPIPSHPQDFRVFWKSRPIKIHHANGQTQCVGGMGWVLAHERTS